MPLSTAILFNNYRGKYIVCINDADKIIGWFFHTNNKLKKNKKQKIVMTLKFDRVEGNCRGDWLVSEALIFHFIWIP